MNDTWLVVGLGNPGPDYERTRHNIGQMVLDQLADDCGLRFKAHKARAVAAEGRLRIGGPKIILAKPLTYMNLSGGPVSALAKFYDIPLDRILPVHDELDIPFGDVRLKRGGGEGGHNGLRDISKAMGSKDYHRVRVGIGRPPGRMDVADFVLKPFSSAENKELPFLINDGVDAVTALIDKGLTEAQQQVHAPRPA
jgi:PTH1 family peptidyl-tRNA hydrolase